MTVEILADFDHDGVIDAPGSSANSIDRFAIVLPLPTCWSNDGKGTEVHVGDAGEVIVRLNGLRSPDRGLSLCVDDAARGKVHLFRRCGARWESLGSEGVWRLGGEKDGEEDVRLGLAAHFFAQCSDAWSGEFALTAAVVAEDGAEIAKDRARFVTAKFLLASSIDPVEEVLVVQNARTAGVVAILEGIVAQAGARLRPLEFEDGTESDVWMQDTVEIGRACVPTRSGVQQGLAALTGLRAHHTDFNAELLDRNVRMYLGRRGAVLVDAAAPRMGTRWIDWYGNLEVSPPVTDRNGREFPCGRILTGRQRELEMHPDLLAFLEAQRVQIPPLVIDVSWLAIGHVDEVVNFVPARDAPGFRALLPSPSSAKNVLADLASRGLEDLAVFAGRDGETTVGEMLETVALSEENARIGDILGEIRACLCEGLRIEEDDFMEIPVLFRDGIAVIPNGVNGLVCNGHAILPDPLGPQVDGEDAFAAPIRRALADVGVEVHFVDVWKPYHRNLGEIHCGTNAIRRIRNPEWWKTLR